MNEKVAFTIGYANRVVRLDVAGTNSRYKVSVILTDDVLMSRAIHGTLHSWLEVYNTRLHSKLSIRVDYTLVQGSNFRPLTALSQPLDEFSKDDTISLYCADRFCELCMTKLQYYTSPYLYGHLSHVTPITVADMLPVLRYSHIHVDAYIYEI